MEKQWILFRKFFKGTQEGMSLGLVILEDCGHFLHFWLFVRPPPGRSVGNLAAWVRKGEGANVF